MKANKFFYVSILLAGLAFPAFSQNPDTVGQDKPAAEDADEAPAKGAPSLLDHMETLASETNQISYSLGVNIARNLIHNYPAANPDFVTLAIRDVFTGAHLKLNEEMINASIARYTTEANRVARERVEHVAEYNLKQADMFLKANGSKEGVVTTPSGLQYRIIHEGTGPKPRPDGSATINYTTRLINGDIVDSTLINGVKPVSVRLETAIPAWKEALAEMPLGSKWDLYAHPKLAYGEKGAKNIGPNELLIFNIELVGVD